MESAVCVKQSRDLIPIKRTNPPENPGVYLNIGKTTFRKEKNERRILSATWVFRALNGCSGRNMDGFCLSTKTAEAKSNR
jgi:hypothetical protein